MEIKDKILDAALQVFAETGYRGATTRRIAQIADVNEVTLFRHFGSKEELIRAAVQYAALQEPQPQLPEQPVDPHRELTEWARLHHARMLERAAIIRICMSESVERPEMAECMCNGPEQMSAQLRSYFERMQSAGLVNATVDVRVVISMLMSALFADAISRDLMPRLHGFPAVEAPARYVGLVLQALGVVPVAGSAAETERAKAATMKEEPRKSGSRGVALGLMLFLLPGTLAAQQSARALSLQDALRLAGEQSEQVTIARAGVQRAVGEQYRARSEYFPQLFGSLGYTRTLKTEFSSITEGDTTAAAPVCPAFNPNRLLPLAERVDSLESALTCRDNANPFEGLFSDLPFGRANQWNLGLSVSQNLFTGGRVSAQNRIATAGKRTAEITLASASAQLVLDVTQAYYDASLSEQLLAIAEATMTQAETTLSQVRLARQVGEQPEFELLRAQVTHDNQRPVVIQRRSDRDLAHMRLKQLLNLPIDESLALTTGLGQGDALPVVSISAVQSDTTVAARAPVRQANEALQIQESLSTIARAQRLPNLSVSSQYGRVAYPGGGLPAWNQFRTNWTVAASVQVPIFTGGRMRGDELVAQANLMESRAQLQQVRELAALDTRNAVERLRAAEAAWQASSGTVELAARAYTIAEIRFKEGISTQIELNDSRLLLQQAQANRAVTARDLQVARMLVALLPDLPLGSGVGSPAGGQGDFGGANQPAQQFAPPRTAPQTQAGRPAVPVQASRGTGNQN